MFVVSSKYEVEVMKRRTIIHTLKRTIFSHLLKNKFADEEPWVPNKLNINGKIHILMNQWISLNYGKIAFIF